MSTKITTIIASVIETTTATWFDLHDFRVRIFFFFFAYKILLYCLY